MQRLCDQLNLQYGLLPILKLDTAHDFSLGKITDMAMRCAYMNKKFLKNRNYPETK